MSNELEDRFRQAGLEVVGRFDDTSPTVTEGFHVMVHVDTVPCARVPKRNADGSQRAQELWTAAARERGVIDGDGRFLAAAGAQYGWVRVQLTADTNLSVLADESGGIEFLARSANGERLCAITTEGSEHWIVDEAYPPEEDVD